MKKFLWIPAFFAVLLTTSTSSFAQSLAGLSTPTRSEIESTIGAMGLSMEEKLSLRNILQAMQEQGEKVKENGSLSNDQKVTQITQIRKDALAQTAKILTAPQQKQLAGLFLP